MLHQSRKACRLITIEPDGDRFWLAAAEQAMRGDGADRLAVGNLEQRCGPLAQIRSLGVVARLL